MMQLLPSARIKRVPITASNSENPDVGSSGNDGSGLSTAYDHFDTFGIVSGLTDGHVATSYAIALIAVLFTAVSYGKLVKRFPSAGSAYTYAQKSISPNVGFMVGWSSLLDYLFMPMINILLAKIYLEAIFLVCRRGFLSVRWSA